MKVITKISHVILYLSLSTMALSSPHITYIANDDSERGGSEDILIDYTICSDTLEKNPTCSNHAKIRVSRINPEKIEFKSEKEVLYIWRASTYVFGGKFIETDYSRDLKSSDNKSLQISNCATTNRKLIVLDTYRTRNIIGCQIIISG